MAGREVYYSCGCYSRDGVTKETLCSEHDYVANKASDEELAKPPPQDRD